MLLTFVVLFPDTINTQVHETMKTTPYELVFGQPPRTVIVPDATTGGIVDERMIHLEGSSSDNDQDSFDDVKEGSNPARQGEESSNSSIHVVEDYEDVSKIAPLMIVCIIGVLSCP